MNKKIFWRLPILATLIVLFFTSCGEEDSNMEVHKATSLEIIASLGNSATSTTRAGSAEIEIRNDGWAYSGFNVGDVLGFYSEHGDFLTDNGEGAFINLPMTCTATTSGFRFKNKDNAQFSPTHMSATEVYMYFPYDEKAEDPGLELRRTKGDDPTLRCVDFLTKGEIDASNLANGILTGTFIHAFSELIIMRGEGFDNPPPGKEAITIVMKQPFSHVKINCTEDPWECSPQLVYSNSYKLSEEQCRRWEAWRGGNFGMTETDEIGEPAWYAILPTLPGNNTAVDYIEIYDNDGALQKVSSLYLRGGNTKYLAEGVRYPMKIMMDELVPTINPYPIIHWNGDVDITDERKRGINDETDFVHWMEAYNAYISDRQKEDNLLQFGDKVNGVWHFYILNDLDLSKLDSITRPTIIPKLNDILDGVSTTLENHTFQNHKLSKIPKTLVDEIAQNGVLQNIDFNRPYVINTEATSVGTGILANKINAGTVENCNITFGTLMSIGPVGIITGTMNGGTIKGCTLEGFISGSQTAEDSQAAKIIGSNPTGSYIFEDNDASNVYFEPTN